MNRPATVPLAIFVALLLSANVVTVTAYAPKQGDFFNYAETVTVNNGQGSYDGYTDQTQITGMEQVNSVTASNVSSHYSLSFQYSNSQGNTTSRSMSGDFVWSSADHQYVKGTDNQVGYTAPVSVWFAIDPATPVGGRVVLLNTIFSMVSTNSSFQLPSEGRYVQAIQANGTGSYQRDDSYGIFTATYTWSAYFDPNTGFIVGYLYVEQDSGQYQGVAGSFTYTDHLSVTSTSYGLVTASPPPSTQGSTGLLESIPYLSLILVLAIVLVVGVSIYVARRRGHKGLPEHSPTPPSLSSSSPVWSSSVNLGSRPPEQVVIRDVAKVNCKYCGTLISTTAETCPYCGGPRR